MLEEKSEAEKAVLARRLTIVLFATAAILTAKTGFDLIQFRQRFPAFFVPVFVLLTAALAVWSGYATFQVRAPRDVGSTDDWLDGTTVWILLAASFVCTTGVHAFYPFRPAPLRSYVALVDYPIWAVNGALALGGFVGMIVLRRTYRSGRRGTALLGIAILGCVLVLPNDECKNPFNYWWLRTIGASPLMYVPNMYAALLGIAALQRIQPRANIAVLVAICLATAALGLGHMSKLIW